LLPVWYKNPQRLLKRLSGKKIKRAAKRFSE